MIDAIDITTDDLHLPADVLGGRVLEKGTLVGAPGLRSYFVVVRCDRRTMDEARVDGMQYGELRKHAVIHCTHEPTRDRLRRVLAAGERCPYCHGTGEGMTWGEADDGPTWGDADADCGTCDGTGYTRQPAVIGSFIDAEIRGDITPAEAAALVWVSVARVDVGMEPARGLQEPTRPGRYTAVCGRMRLGTGSEGDGDVVSDAYALRVDGALLLPHPDGVRRLVLS